VQQQPQAAIARDAQPRVLVRVPAFGRLGAVLGGRSGPWLRPGAAGGLDVRCPAVPRTEISARTRQRRGPRCHYPRTGSRRAGVHRHASGGDERPLATPRPVGCPNRTPPAGSTAMGSAARTRACAISPSATDRFEQSPTRSTANSTADSATAPTGCRSKKTSYDSSDPREKVAGTFCPGSYRVPAETGVGLARQPRPGSGAGSSCSCSTSCITSATSCREAR